MEIRCPHCDRILKDYEIKSRWCNTCNKPIGDTEEQIAKNIEKRQQIEAALKGMLLTTGNVFEGYKIIKYIDVYFDEIVFGMGFTKSLSASIDNLQAAFYGEEATVVTKRLNEVKNILKERLMEKAVENGANALLGIDFESSSIGDLMMVSMTATAVVIEPEQ